MANTMSAKKNTRSSLRKRAHNDSWKQSYKALVKAIKADLTGAKNADVTELNNKLRALYVAVDKAAKEKVIHKNRANRLKSIYARKISASLSKPTTKAASKPRKSSK